MTRCSSAERKGLCVRGEARESLLGRSAGPKRPEFSFEDNAARFLAWAESRVDNSPSAIGTPA